jgi:hypothetical protein
MADPYTKNGRPLQRRGDDLFSRSGQHVGRIRGRKVYGPDGRYAGTIDRRQGRLPQHRQRRSKQPLRFVPQCRNSLRKRGPIGSVGRSAAVPQLIPICLEPPDVGCASRPAWATFRPACRRACQRTSGAGMRARCRTSFICHIGREGEVYRYRSGLRVWGTGFGCAWHHSITRLASRS